MAHAAALSYLGEILEPLEFVVWGEVAMARLGVPLVPHVSLHVLQSIYSVIVKY